MSVVGMERALLDWGTTTCATLVVQRPLHSMERWYGAFWMWLAKSPVGVERRVDRATEAVCVVLVTVATLPAVGVAAQPEAVATES